MTDTNDLLTDDEMARLIALDIIVSAIQYPEHPIRGWDHYPNLTGASWGAVQAYMNRLGNQLQQRMQEEAYRDGIDLPDLIERAQ